MHLLGGYQILTSSLALITVSRVGSYFYFLQMLSLLLLLIFLIDSNFQILGIFAIIGREEERNEAIRTN